MANGMGGVEMESSEVEATDEHGVAVVQVMDSIGLDRGGLTRAVFDRFRLLAAGRRAVLVTVAYQPDVRAIFEELKDRGELPSHTTLLSFHEDLHTAVVDGEKQPQLEDAFSRCVNVPDGPNLSRFYSNGSFVGLESRRASGDVVMRERYSDTQPWVLLERERTYGASTGLIEVFDADRQVRYRKYLTFEGRCALASWVTPGGYEYRCVDFRRSNPIVELDMRKSNANWLYGHLRHLGRCVIYTDEPRATFALEVDLPYVAHVSSVHTTHLANNVDNSDGLKHWTKHLTKFRQNVDYLVTFTEVQRAALVKDLDWDENRSVTMRHRAPDCDVNVDRSLRSGLCIVGRLAADKRVDIAIRAFAQVAEEFPDESLKICGKGPELASLQRLVADLGLDAQVEFVGHVADPLQVFAEAKGSILTSKYEGFGLVLLESMSRGTPVAAFDVIYGPRDVIRNGVNGYLVSDGDVEQLSVAMHQLLDDTNGGILSEGCYATARAYDERSWAAGWLEVHRRACMALV